jgi:hypothetical protein
MALVTTKDGAVVKSEFVGCVVATFTREERVMSDVYADVLHATVYNVEKDAFEDMYVRAYFELDNGERSATVDATPEVVALYEAHKAVQEAEAKLNEAKRYRTRELEALKAPAPGRTVKVVKGRKVPIGTVGKCFYLRDGEWGPRVGIKDADGQVHWTSAKNVEAVIS